MRARRIRLSGWGRMPVATVDAYRPERLPEVAACLAAAPTVIAHGGGRSYGDQALNAGGAVILTGRLDRMLAFDAATGVLACEPGVTFADVLASFGPRGWQLPVSPGTGHATLGGAVANDVHGKNHDAKGSFGDHVRWLDLALPSGEIRRVEPDTPLFRATVGGMGLTGVIVGLAVALMRVPSNAVDLTERRVGDLDDFMAALAEARDRVGYSVGWIDALASGRRLGRGIVELADLAPADVAASPKRLRAVPVDFPGFALNPLSVRVFNAAYFHRVPAGGRQRRIPVGRFLYPLDAIGGWNRIYGRRGFHQFQCVIPDAEARMGLVRLLEAVSHAGAASFLAVLKTLGGPGPGMMSFPLRGFTLALDFPHRADTASLLHRLETITLDHGGRVYLAKDSAATAAAIRRMYPELDAFRAVLAEIDPTGKLTSDMARRLQLRAPA